MELRGTQPGKVTMAYGTDADITETPEQNYINHAMRCLVEGLRHSIIAEIREELSGLIEDALSDYDPTMHDDFEEAVKNAMQSFSFTLSAD